MRSTVCSGAFVRSLSLALTLALTLAAGCASTKVTDQQSEIGSEKIARPGRIIVHDFAVTPADLPPGSAVVEQAAAPAAPMTQEELAAGQALGQAVAKELISEINSMGMHAVPAEGNPGPEVGDIAIFGAFVSIDEGSGAERAVVGFGKGNANLKTFVEGFLKTEQGLRRLGSGDVGAGGGKSPGLGASLLIAVATKNPVGLVVGGAAKAYGEASGKDTIEGSGKRTAQEIAKELKVRFEQQGWISSD